MKKILQLPIALAIIALAIGGKSLMDKSKKEPGKKTEKNVKVVSTIKVLNDTLPVQIQSTGSILAKERTVLYAEVQGIFKQTSKLFKPGINYSKGQPLIRIDDSEFLASVKSQRINFKSLIISLLADIQFDYPAELSTWKNYANEISSDKMLPDLPDVENENFSNYISGKAVFTNFYTIRNLETRLQKYTISAPFDGVLVEANITPGTLVTPGQKLGEFIKTGVYELELNVNASRVDYLKIGKKVTLFNSNHSATYEGKVSRINPQVDRGSQTIQMFVEIISDELNEGEYLEADIEAQQLSDVFEMDRSLIVDQTYVFTVEDNVLVKVPVTIVHANENTVLVRGLKDASELVAFPISGGYEGMKVTVKN